MTKMSKTGAIAAAIAAGVLLAAAPASAQLDPLLFLKRTQPNVIIAIDTANRMQRDTDNNYRDPNIYKVLGTTWEPALGINGTNTSATYRRKFVGLVNTDNGTGTSDKFSTDHIEVAGDLQTDGTYAHFDDFTRLSLAKKAVTDAITLNTGVARFGLVRMRQNNGRFLTPASTGSTLYTINEGPVAVTNAAYGLQQVNGDYTSTRWAITRPVVDSSNGSVSTSGLLVTPGSSSNTSVVSSLSTLVPGGRDSKTVVDAPVENILNDAKAAATSLISSDTDCRNTVVVLIVGGGEGNSTSGDPAGRAKDFLSISGHRVPIYVIAIAPQTDTERSQLQAVAANSGGQYYEITSADLPPTAAASATMPSVPKILNAINTAISHAFENQADFDKAPDSQHPYGYDSEFQVTSPIVGTVNLENAKDITGSALPNTVVYNPADGTKIPQRSNVMLTTSFLLPGYRGTLRAFRVYKPVADATKPIGYSFNSDGTRLWVACVPGTPSTQCAAQTYDNRNIYTSLPDGTVIPFTTANASLLWQYLLPDCTAGAATCATYASSLITSIRQQPLGAVLDSTPAIMDVPSLDPPPDSDYPAYATAGKDRRSIIWVGANDGMLHGIDGRLGEEVWAFIPFNLLPKLNALQGGQATGAFKFYVDGSPKIADVKVDGKWRTYLVMGEGPGGTFYQTFDVSLDNEALTVSPSSDDITSVLTYFSTSTAVPLKWAFPKYSDFDVTCTFNSATTPDCPNSKGPLGQPWGDIAKAAPTAEKTIGQTWSDPAIGQVETASGRFVVLTGSGFFRYSRQTDPNRSGTVAGSTFYILDVKDGSVLDYKDVGNDNKAEKIDNCTDSTVNNCSQLKNALQADVVATGPADSRFITKAYLGDLDGRIWRFDVGLDGSGVPKIKQLVNLYTLTGTSAQQPIFSSMATVNVGGTLQYLFVGTGSDLLPSAGVNTAYGLYVILDQGTSGSKTAQISLQTVDSQGGDEKVTSFPAVAGDIVFFSTTTFKQGGCSLPDANLYAFTFIGGPAYDTNNDGRLSNTDSTKVRTTTGARASAPFIVDQHLVFSTGGKVEMFGDPTDFNNGVGQAGVRILSWREVR